MWIKRWNWIAGSILVFLAIVAEALQSHALEGIGADKAANYLTATRFMFFNGLGLIVLHLLYERHRSRSIYYSGLLILAGTVFFSFTIILKLFIEMQSWGWVTPFGGILLMAGWLLMIITTFRAKY
ncbi:MAG: DUF423 domain-containing protein [Bacteroidales bacterium]|nr:DUF423 domain-containing protein [Bacteroidales bacterium]MCF8337843.1 DUF423 domain-containing protein [Bacteroidales bacterium]